MYHLGFVPMLPLQPDDRPSRVLGLIKRGCAALHRLLQKTSLYWRLTDAVMTIVAKHRASFDGWWPDEIIPVGPCATADGDGPEYPAWFFYHPRHAARYDLAPLGLRDRPAPTLN
jgi:hypothetical protein